MGIRVLIADDHKIVRDGLRGLLEAQPQVTAIFEAADGRAALSTARKFNPDVVIMDISMPELNGVDATRQLRDEMPGLKIIALSMHADKRFVDQMLRAGVSGYLIKDCAFEELILALKTVSAGKVYLSPIITGVVLEEYLAFTPLPGGTARADLTTREREVLQLIAEGCSTRDISQRLNVSVKTVESHRRNIQDKLGTRSVAELTKIAIREGLTSV